MEEARRRTEPDNDRAFLGALLDETPEGGVVQLEQQTYLCPVFVERSVSVVGPEGGLAVLAGVPGEHVVQVTADDAEVVFERLVIRGGGGTLGALAVTGARSRVLLRNCLILDNSSTMEGPAAGGVNITSGSLTLEGCVLAENRGSTGGALCVRQSAWLEARSCLFVGNISVRGGGAVWVEESARGRFVNCTFVDNISDDGGMGFTLQAKPSTGRTPDVSLVNCVLRSAERCFGYEGLGTGPIRARHTILPPHAREYSVLDADDSTWFGVPEFATEGLLFALSLDGPWPVEGDASAWDGSLPTGLWGEAFGETVPRGATKGGRSETDREGNGDGSAQGAQEEQKEPQAPEEQEAQPKAGRAKVVLGCLAGIVALAIPVMLYLWLLTALGLRNDPTLGTLYLVLGAAASIVVMGIISMVGESLIEDVVKFVLIGGAFAFIARGQPPNTAAVTLGITVGTFMPLLLRVYTPFLELLGIDVD